MEENKQDNTSIESVKKQIKEKFDGNFEDVRITVHREFPHWCKGYQATITCDMNTDLETIKQNFGGGDYLLKFIDSDGNYVARRKVAIGGDPKIEGVPTSEAEHIRQKKQKQQIENTPVINNDASETIRPIIELMQQQLLQQQQQTNQLLETIVQEKNNSQAIVHQPQNTNAIDDMHKYFELFKNMNSAASGSMNIEPMVSKFIDVLSESQKKERHGYQSPIKLGDKEDIKNEGENINENNENNEDDDWLDELAQWEPEEQVEAFANLYQRNDPEKRKKIMEHFQKLAKMAGDEDSQNKDQ